MTTEVLWALGVGAAVLAVVIGFFVGRMTGGPKKKVAALSAELERAQEENSRYRKEVDAHFDKTATLFVSMAGSYKALFEHLSSGYEQLSDGSARDLFRQRVDASLLIGAPEGRTDPLTQGEPVATTGEHGAPVEETRAETPETASTPISNGECDDVSAGDQASPAMPDGEPVLDTAQPESPGLPEAERRAQARAEPSEYASA